MRRARWIWGAAAALLSACGGTQPQHQEPDGSVVIQPDAGPSCGYGHVEEGRCVTQVDWVPGADDPNPRDHQATFAWKAPNGERFLYVAGGYRESPVTFYSEVQVATLDENGIPLSWTASTPLPRGVAGMGVAQVGDRVYISGGKELVAGKLKLVSSVWSAQLLPGGTVGPWRAETSFSDPRFHHTTVSSGQTIYLIGGTRDLPHAFGDVQRATVGTDGVLTEWTQATPLPKPRTHFAAVVANGAIYVIGGMDNGTDPAEDVLRSEILADGSLGPWTVVGKISSPPSTHSAVVIDGLLYVIGGLTPEPIVPTAQVRRAFMFEDGSLGPFVAIEPLPRGRGHVHQTPALDGRIYSVGGNMGNHVQTREVFTGILY